MELWRNGVADTVTQISRKRLANFLNNQFRPVPEVTAPNWVAVIQRSLDTASRASTATAVRHLFAMAEVARLKRKVDADVRRVSIPGDWFPPVAGIAVARAVGCVMESAEVIARDQEVT